MADFRKVSPDMWRSDEWFQELPTDGRLLWIYLFTGPSVSISGIYKIPLKTMAFETGLIPERVQELLDYFAASDKAYYEDSIIWVRNLRRYQAGTTPSPTVLVGIEKDLAKIPYCPLKERYCIHYGYSTDTVPIPALIRDVDVDVDVDVDRDETEIGAPPPKPAAKPKPGAKRPPTDPNLQHPAISAYRDICRLTPAVAVRQDIVETVADIELWKETLHTWLLKGWNPRNIGGQLDVYRNGFRERTNGSKPDPSYHPMRAAAEVEAAEGNPRAIKWLEEHQ